MTKRKLAVITGSVREGRFGPTITRWIAGRARRHGHFEVAVIDPADTPPPAEHLRQVFNEMHAVTIRDWISFDQHWTKFGPGGELPDPEGPDGAAKAMPDQLGWWSRVLREARLTTPYQA